LTADVFVAHDLPMLPVARQAADRSGAKLVYDSHELYSEQEFSDWEKKRWREIEARYIGGCDRIMTINPTIAAELERRYGMKNIGVVYNAEHRASFFSNEKLFHQAFSLPPSCKILLYQGGLSANRHIEALVACMQLVKNADIHLVVLGEGSLRKKLEKIAAHRRVAHRVHFHDAVPQKDLLRYTVCADGGIIPYQATCLNNYLCTPNKLFEFIVAGLPILANDLPEMRSFIAGYDIGLLGDLRTDVAFAAAIDEFFSDRARLDHWCANAKTAAQSVCWEEEEKKVIAAYNSLLD
jgi:glycosyltransferase involved in cell wall biosynthesis